MTAPIYEIFSGIQGEGALVGTRQVLVRTTGCDARCAYCDTPAGREGPPLLCRVEMTAGERQMTLAPNPMSVAEVMEVVLRLEEGYPHHSVSITGGEPLMHPGFVAELIAALRAAGLRSYLETNGLRAAEWRALTTAPDFLAADIKLPSATRRDGRWEDHEEFLRHQPWPAAEVAGRMQVKAVFAEGSLPDVERAAALVAACCPQATFVLQPLTPRDGAPHAPLPATVLAAQALARTHVTDVRVIPQTHVALGQW